MRLKVIFDGIDELKSKKVMTPVPSAVVTILDMIVYLRESFGISERKYNNMVLFFEGFEIQTNHAIRDVLSSDDIVTAKCFSSHDTLISDLSENVPEVVSAAVDFIAPSVYPVSDYSVGKQGYPFSIGDTIEFIKKDASPDRMNTTEETTATVEGIDTALWGEEDPVIVFKDGNGSWDTLRLCKMTDLKVIKLCSQPCEANEVTHVAKDDTLSPTNVATHDASSHTQVATVDAPSHTQVATVDAPSQMYVATVDATVDAPSHTQVATVNAPLHMHVATVDAPSHTQVHTHDASSHTQADRQNDTPEDMPSQTCVDSHMDLHVDSHVNGNGSHVLSDTGNSHESIACIYLNSSDDEEVIRRTVPIATPPVSASGPLCEAWLAQANLWRKRQRSKSVAALRRQIEWFVKNEGSIGIEDVVNRSRIRDLTEDLDDVVEAITTSAVIRLGDDHIIYRNTASIQKK